MSKPIVAGTAAATPAVGSGTKPRPGHVATGVAVDLTAMAVPMATLSVREQSYIPTALARKTIDAMHADMTALRKRHVEKLTEVAEYFQTVEDATKRKFVTFVEAFRATAQNEITAHKLSLQQASTQLREQHEQLEQSTQRIAALEELMRAHERSASDASELAQANMASAESRHSEVRPSRVRGHLPPDKRDSLTVAPPSPPRRPSRL